MDKRIGVTSRTFSRNEQLTRDLYRYFDHVKLNSEGLALRGQQLIDFLADCDGAIVALEKVDREVLLALPRLKVLAKFGVGLDNIDTAFMKSQGIVLGWTGGVNARSVSELTLCFMLGITRNVFSSIELMRAGNWLNAGGNQMTGKTVGIIGFGNIGRDLAKLLQPFQCQLLVNDILDVSEWCKPYGARPAEKEEIYRNSDLISLHIPFTEQTQGLIKDRELALMKKSAILINTSRGGIVDESALARALRGQRLAAAAMDVFANEPYQSEELLSQLNFFATPHIGGSAAEAVLAMGKSAVENLCKGFQC